VDGYRRPYRTGPSHAHARHQREAIQQGSTYRYALERIPVTVGTRFAFFTAVGTPEYALATAAQRDPGAFFANADGSGFGPLDPPYLFG
jgi:hypothetical protein